MSTEQNIQELKLPPVYQLGYVVKDIDRACEFYTSTFGKRAARGRCPKISVVTRLSKTKKGLEGNRTRTCIPESCKLPASSR